MRHDHKGTTEEGGEARVRRAMERVERDHDRRRKNAIAAGVVAAVLALAATASVLSGLGSASALGRGEKPPIAATVTRRAPERPVAIETHVATSDPKPVPKPKPKPAGVSAPKPAAVTVQRLNIRIGDLGYEPSVVRASAGRPITLTVGRGEGCAAGFLMPDLGIQKDNSSGPVTFKLGSLKRGTYRFTCGMAMIEGRLVVG